MVKAVRLARLEFGLLRASLLAPPAEDVGAAKGRDGGAELQPAALFEPDVLRQVRFGQAVGIESDVNRFRNGRQIPHGVEHHHVLLAVIGQHIPGLVFDLRRFRIRRPALEDHLPRLREFFGQLGVFPLLDDLRLGRFRAAVGVVHDEPAILGLDPLGPERHVVP